MKISDLVPKSILGAGKDDAVSLLIADHDEVKDLFEQFEEIKDVTDVKGINERQRIAAQVCSELTIHTTIEEEIFYPALSAVIDDSDMMNEAQVEHNGAKDLISQLEKMSAKDEMFNATFKVLAEYVQHHIKEEQGEMFPKARGTDLDLEALGTQMRARKEELKKAKRPARRPTNGKGGETAGKSAPVRSRAARPAASTRH